MTTTGRCDWCDGRLFDRPVYVEYTRRPQALERVAPVGSYESCGEWDFCSDICLQYWKDQGRRSKREMEGASVIKDNP